MKHTLMKWLTIILIGVINAIILNCLNIEIDNTWWAGVIFALVITNITIYMEE